MKITLAILLTKYLAVCVWHPAFDLAHNLSKKFAKTLYSLLLRELLDPKYQTQTLRLVGHQFSTFTMNFIYYLTFKISLSLLNNTPKILRCRLLKLKNWSKGLTITNPFPQLVEVAKLFNETSFQVIDIKMRKYPRAFWKKRGELPASVEVTMDYWKPTKLQV